MAALMRDHWTSDQVLERWMYALTAQIMDDGESIPPFAFCFLLASQRPISSHPIVLPSLIIKFPPLLACLSMFQFHPV
jgi:hypothetical protein